MIPLGHLSVGNRSVGNDRTTRLSKDEQITMMSLWAIAPSPLMLGMNLPDNDAWTLSLLTNDEVLAINQDAAGKQAIRLPQPTEQWERKSGLANWRTVRMLSACSTACAFPCPFTSAGPTSGWQR